MAVDDESTINVGVCNVRRSAHGHENLKALKVKVGWALGRIKCSGHPVQVPVESFTKNLHFFAYLARRDSNGNEIEDRINRAGEVGVIVKHRLMEAKYVSVSKLIAKIDFCDVFQCKQVAVSTAQVVVNREMRTSPQCLLLREQLKQ